MKYKLKGYNVIHEGVVPDFVNDDHVVFYADTGAGRFEFDAWYYNEQWNIYCTLPNGDVRACGAWLGAWNWAGFTDFGVVWENEVNKYAAAGLAKSRYKIVEWL